MVWPDGVTVLPDGGFVATSLWDPHDKQFLDKLSNAQPVGGLIEWHPKQGWKEIGPAGMSGPNRVVSSQDGKTLYVNLWSEKKILKYDRETKASAEGQHRYAARQCALEPGPHLYHRRRAGRPGQGGDRMFRVEGRQLRGALQALQARPSHSMKLTELVKSGIHDGMGAGTGGLQVGPDLWAASYRSDRIIRFPGVLAK